MKYHLNRNLTKLLYFLEERKRNQISFFDIQLHLYITLLSESYGYLKLVLQLFKSIRKISWIISFLQKVFFLRILLLSPISISLIKFVKGVNNLESFELRQFNFNTCSEQSLEQGPNPKKILNLCQ